MQQHNQGLRSLKLPACCTFCGLKDVHGERGQRECCTTEPTQGFA